MVTIVTGIVSLLIFNGLTGYFLYTSFDKAETLSAVPVDVYQLIFGICGVCMVIVGNIMPKVRMNSVLGLRTVWSMKNETVWKKSQRFGGISFVISGILLVVVSFAAKGTACLVWSLAIMMLCLLVDVYYTYHQAKKA